MTSDAPARPPIDWSRALRDGSLSMLIGAGVVFLMYLDRPQPFGWRLAAYGALGGASIYAACRILHRLAEKWLQRRLRLPARVTAAVALFLGGVVGWSFATAVARATGLVHFTSSGGEIVATLALTGCLGLVFGLGIYSFNVMETRLVQSGARLKEAEFAEKELELARSIQRRLLPPGEIEGEGFRVWARNLPARFVAGDFYDVFPLPDGTLGLVTADVSGKGMGAALVMASVKAVVPLVAASSCAASTLTNLNRKLAAELAPREFVALCFARFDPATGALEIANAGLPDPYWLRAQGGVEAIGLPDPRWPLGARSDVAYGQVRIVLAPGDRVLFLTDGLPEAPVPDGGPLGYEAFVDLVAAGAAAGSVGGGEFLDRLFEQVRAATSPILQDDWTALLLERPASAAG